MKKQTQFNNLGVRRHKDGNGFTIQASKAYGYTGAIGILVGIGIVSAARPLASYLYLKAKPGISKLKPKLRGILPSAREDKSN